MVSIVPKNLNATQTHSHNINNTARLEVKKGTSRNVNSSDVILSKIGFLRESEHVRWEGNNTIFLCEERGWERRKHKWHSDLINDLM